MGTKDQRQKVGIVLMVVGLIASGFAIWAAVDVRTDEGWINALGWWSGCMTTGGLFTFLFGVDWS